MPQTAPAVAESRRFPRLRLPAMYTLLRVKAKGERRFRHTGYIYDISQSGMRFELDDPLPAGAQIEIRALLPGHTTTTIRAAGTVVRLHDDEIVGPTRMGLTFTRFRREQDQDTLRDYIDTRVHAAA